VRWEVVRQMGFAWLITIPATAVLAIGVLGLWRWLT
jgi:phosphate/sulfate permease